MALKEKILKGLKMEADFEKEARMDMLKEFNQNWDKAWEELQKKLSQNDEAEIILSRDDNYDVFSLMMNKKNNSASLVVREYDDGIDIDPYNMIEIDSIELINATKDEIKKKAIEMAINNGETNFFYFDCN